MNSSDRYVNHLEAPDVPTKIKKTSKKRGVEHKGVGFTGSSFSAQASLHQMFIPGCILAWVNPVWDALIFLCQTTPTPQALKGREAFQAIDATRFSRKTLSQDCQAGVSLLEPNDQVRACSRRIQLPRAITGAKLSDNFVPFRVRAAFLNTWGLSTAIGSIAPMTAGKQGAVVQPWDVPSVKIVLFFQPLTGQTPTPSSRYQSETRRG